MPDDGFLPALRPSDLGVGLLFERVTDAVIVADAASGRVVLWNPAAERMFGFSAEEMQGRTLDAIIPAHLRLRHAAGLARYRAGGRGPFIDAGRPLDLPALHRSGREIAVEMTLSPVGDEAGEGRLALAIIRDVTAQRRAEQERDLLQRERLASANARIGEILESIDDAFYAVDADFRFTYVNRHAEQVWGTPRAQLLGRTLWEEFPALGDGKAERELRRAAAERRAAHFEVRSTVTGGWLEVHAYPHAGGLSVYFRDVTERQRAEAREHLLAEAATALADLTEPRAILERMAALLLPTLGDYSLVDVVADGRVERVAVAHADPARAEGVAHLRAFAGAGDPESPVARSIREGRSELVPDITPAALEAAIADPAYRQALLELGVRAALIVPLQARGHVLGAITLVSAERGDRYSPADRALAEALAGRCALALDNARLLEAERQARARAEEAVKEREEFLSAAAHELKTPLTSLRGFTQLLLRRPDREQELDPARLRQVLRTIDQQSRRLATLVEQLLDVSRAGVGTPAPARQEVDLSALAAEALEAQRPLAGDRPLRLTAPGPVVTLADPLRLGQVLANLLDNAVRHSPPGAAVDVTVAVAGEEASISVRDRGPGVPAALRERIFDRFFQVQPERHGSPGLGLGLYLARQIVERHGGRIWCEAAAPGANFCVALPLPGG